MSGEFWVREHRCYIRPSYKASPALLMMTKRSLLIFMLLVAFLLSAWGNVIAAAFCPHYLSLNGCSKHDVRQVAQVEPKSCHHEMADMKPGDMQMDEMQMSADAAPASDVDSSTDNQPTQISTESSVEQIAIDLPIEPCGHCWMHSQPSPGMSTVATIEPSPRSLEVNAATAEFQIVSPSAYPISALRLEHGPPGNAFPRHVLINVFRI